MHAKQRVPSFTHLISAYPASSGRLWQGFRHSRAGFRMTASEPSKELPTLKTPKALLHELLQINYSSARPEYVTEKVGTIGNTPVFRTTVVCPPWTTPLGKTVHTIHGEGEANTKKESQHRAAAQVLMALRQIEGVFWPQLILPQAAQYETEMIAEWLST